MKLAFNNEAHYTDFENAFALYRDRARGGDKVDLNTYKKVIRCFCKRLSERLVKEGMVDLPCDMGSITAASIMRKPQYRGKKFVGYGKMDWKKGHYDGKLKAFGLVYLPRRGQLKNLRSFGYVANRQLFKRMKQEYESDDCCWEPIEFNDEMI